jgi:hypothetical protein
MRSASWGTTFKSFLHVLSGTEGTPSAGKHGNLQIRVVFKFGKRGSHLSPKLNA